MKDVWKGLRSCLVIVMLLAGLAVRPNEAKAAGLNYSKMTLMIGQTVDLKTEGISGKVKWSSTNSKVAQVTAKGQVKARQSGSATIKAAVGKKNYSCKIKVVHEKYKTVTLKFNSMESWINAVNTTETGLMFGGKITVPDLSGHTYYTGNIIIGRQVLEYKTVSVKISQNTPGYWKTVTVKFPYKIKYHLHRHEMKTVGGSEGLGLYVAGIVEGNIKWRARCSCGLNSEYSWEIPVDQELLEGSSNSAANSSVVTSISGKYTPSNSAGTTKTQLGKSKIIKVSSTKQKKMLISWKKVSKADAYQIYRAASKNGKYKKIKTVKASVRKYTDKVSSGKTYYYKIRAYKKSGRKTVYGKFSPAKGATEIGARWYKKVLSSTRGSYRVRHQIWKDNSVIKTVQRKEFTHYKVMDINKDGVKELLLSTPLSDRGFDNRILILTYYNNKVKPLICFVGNGYRGEVKITKRQILLLNSDSSESYRVDYKISAGKLKKVRDMEYINYKYVKKYYVNGRSVSEETWRNASSLYSPYKLPEIKYKRI